MGYGPLEGAVKVEGEIEVTEYCPVRPVTDSDVEMLQRDLDEFLGDK